MRLIDADALIAEYPDDVLTHCDIEAAPTIGMESLRPQWIPVEERLPENAAHLGAFCPKYMVMTKYGVTEGWYNPDKESWFILFWFMTERLLEHEISFERGDVPSVVKVPLHMGIVTAWMPLPKPYKPVEEMKEQKYGAFGSEE